MRKITSILVHLYQISWIRWVAIPAVLFFLWVILSLFFNSYANFTTLTKTYDRYSLTKTPKGELLKSESINGEFKAYENNLGILAIRFNSLNAVVHDDEDVLIFRIKEKGQKKWWYQNMYRSGGIYGTPFYPFGFPQIVNSKGKIYQFSLTSLKGNKMNAVSLSGREPLLVSKYVYTKNQLFNDKKVLLIFLYRKVINSFSDMDFLVASISYLLPFILYIFALVVFTKEQIDRYSFLFLVPFLIVLSIIWGMDLIPGIVFAIIGFWVITVIQYRLESSMSFLFAFIFLTCAFILVVFQYQDIAGRLSNWTYFFLCIGAIQLLIEFRSPTKERLTYLMFFKKIFFKKKKLK